MNKVKMLVAALLIGFAGIASAIDVAHSLVITNANAPVLAIEARYSGLTATDLAKMAKVEQKFVAAVTQVGKAAAVSKKPGTYTLTLTGAVSDDSRLLNAIAPIVVEKLTLKDVNRIMRANQSFGNALVADSEMQDAKGKKPWGNK